MMKFDKKITINFHLDIADSELPFYQLEVLEGKCKERIFQQHIVEGYTSGELCESMGKQDFLGWWSYKIENN